MSGQEEEKKVEIVEQVDVDRIDIENVERNQLFEKVYGKDIADQACLLYTSPSPRDQRGSRMPSSA